jgi:hypothetical protein
MVSVFGETYGRWYLAFFPKIVEKYYFTILKQLGILYALESAYQLVQALNNYEA